MATPAEHYATAEMYAEAVAGDYELDDAAIRVYLDLAQIHATLSLAPATVADEAAESDAEPKALASLDAKNGPAAVNDRANERDTSRSTE